eukprot:TRINITY_DN7944_c0_g1_i2.p1 TRINITY_DN7944_c0_g1~~TRINITY_DN7944_c0_g1_i2.p1  ORF type:complete len:118 (+),score=19.04 TRINITY_DN7944_c0_g1_i2:937-1290(+)
MAGQDRFRKLWHHYYIHAKAFIYVIDSNDIERIPQAAEELKKLITEEELKDIPFLIFANKQDLPYAVDVKALADYLNIYCITRPWHIQSCCAPEGGGLLEGIDWLSEIINQQEERKT